MPLKSPLRSRSILWIAEIQNKTYLIIFALHWCVDVCAHHKENPHLIFQGVKESVMSFLCFSGNHSKMIPKSLKVPVGDEKSHRKECDALSPSTARTGKLDNWKLEIEA